MIPHERTTDPGPRPGVSFCAKASLHVKHPEAREIYAENAWTQGPRIFAKGPRINPRLFAKGPRRRQIKERGPRGPVLKYLIGLDVPRFVVPKAREQ